MPSSLAGCGALPAWPEYGDGHSGQQQESAGHLGRRRDLTQDQPRRRHAHNRDKQRKGNHGGRRVDTQEPVPYPVAHQGPENCRIDGAQDGDQFQACQSSAHSGRPVDEQ